jgi:hypothetical protein
MQILNTEILREPVNWLVTLAAALLGLALLAVVAPQDDGSGATG